jgi:hypothetical protein
MRFAPTQPFATLVRVVIACLVIVVWWYATKSQDPAKSDATGDWILVNAVSTGLSPFEDVRTLAPKLGVPYQTLASDDEPVVAYRTPGGILLLYPLVLFEWDQAHAVIGVVGLLFFMWMLLVQVPKLCEVPINRLIFPLALASISAAWIETPYWGTVSSIVGTLMIATLLGTGSSQGVPLAAATVLKLFPGLLFVPLAIKRRSATAIGLGVVAITTALGITLFGLSIVDATRLLAAGSKTWLTKFGNVSLVSVLAGDAASAIYFAAGVTAGIVGIAIFATKYPITQALALAIPVSVLVSPVSWVHYDVVLIPLVIWLWTRSGYSLGRYTALSWLVFEAMASYLAQLGQTGLVRVAIVVLRILVAVAIALAPSRLWLRSEPARELQLTG